MRDDELTLPREMAARPVTAVSAVALPLACLACGARYEAGTRFCANDGSTLPEPAADSMAGLVIAERYRLGRKLGAGGVGEVYLAEHLRIGRPCAIKLLRPDLRAEPEAIGRFVREATNASRINHPHVTQIYDFGEAAGGLVYLAMEYVRGEPLAQLLVRDGPFDARRVAVIIRQVAAGLDAAHALGIVHRDLKPENVILRPSSADSGLDDVKIIDFGLARVFGDRAQQVTDPGCFVGTPHYMAPEQLLPGVIDWRCDVYALGLLGFVLLTGRLPVDGDSALEVMRLRLTEPPLTLGAVQPTVAWPVELDEVFAHALARRAVDRYQSAGAFAGDLYTVIAAWTTPPVAGPTVAHVDLPTTAPRGSVGARRHPRRARSLFTAVGAAVALAGVVAATLLIAVDNRGATTVATAPGTIAAPSAPTPGASVRPAISASAAPALGASAKPVPAHVTTYHGAPLTAMPRASATSLPPVSPPPAAEAAQPEEATRAVLDRIEGWTDARTVERGSAERALAAIPGLLPRLTTRSDSVEALYRAAEADIALGRENEACATLATLRTQAVGTPFTHAVTSLGDGAAVTCP